MPDSYTLYHQRLLRQLVEAVARQSPFCSADAATAHSEFLGRLQNLLKLSPADPDYLHRGQQLICRIVAAYPHITPLVPRDLFWFFGGDCLHFMPDEEIQRYQALDERRAEVEADNGVFDYERERARAFGLH